MVRNQASSIKIGFVSSSSHAVESHFAIACGSQGIGVYEYQNGSTIMSGWWFKRWKELGSEKMDYNGAVE